MRLKLYEKLVEWKQKSQGRSVEYNSRRTL